MYHSQASLRYFQPSNVTSRSDDVGTTAFANTDSNEAGWESYIPAVKEFFFGKGSRTDAAVMEAKVASLRKQVSTAVWPLKALYESELAKAEAELAALRVQAGEEEQAVKVQQAIRLVALTAGIAATAALIAVTVNQLQTARR